MTKSQEMTMLDIGLTHVALIEKQGLKLSGCLTIRDRL